MKKSIVLTLFSMLLMVISNSASASLCSYKDSDCMTGKAKVDSEKSMYSNKYVDDSIWALLTKVEDLLTRIDDHVKNDSPYWDDDESDKPSRDMKHGKSDKYNNNNKHNKGDKPDKNIKWLADKNDDDDFDGLWMYGYGKKGHHSFKKSWKYDSHMQYHYSGMPAVPVPAAVWLFGSGLIGLAAFSRRKKSS